MYTQGLTAVHPPLQITSPITVMALEPLLYALLFVLLV